MMISITNKKTFSKEQIISINIEIVENIKKGKATYGDLALNNRTLLYWIISHKICWEKYDFVEQSEVINSAIMIYMEKAEDMVKKGYSFDTSEDFYKLMLETVSELKSYFAENYYEGGIKMPYSTQKLYVKQGRELPHVITGSVQDKRVDKTPEDIILKKEEDFRKEQVILLMKSVLNDMEREVIQKKFFKKEKINEIAEEMNVTPAKIIYISKKATKKLAAAFH